MNKERQTSRLKERMKKISPKALEYVEQCHALVDRIFEVLEILGIDQKELADRMGKHESEISKLLSGEHNMTYKTILKMQSVLGVELIQIPKGRNAEREKTTVVFVSLSGFEGGTEIYSEQNTGIPASLKIHPRKLYAGSYIHHETSPFDC